MIFLKLSLVNLGIFNSSQFSVLLNFYFSFRFSQFLIVPAIVGSALLHRLSDDCWEKITAWIYGMGLCALFIVSTVFHIVAWKKSHLRYREWQLFPQVTQNNWFGLACLAGMLWAGEARSGRFPSWQTQLSHCSGSFLWTGRSLRTPMCIFKRRVFVQKTDKTTLLGIPWQLS